MDVIAPDQLENYTSIIDRINSEHEKSEKLRKEVELLDHKITTVKLSTATDRPQIAHGHVKVFNTIPEIQTLYESQVKNLDFKALTRCTNCKFYAIEIYLDKILSKKLHGWKLQISIKHAKEGLVSCRTVSLSSKLPIVDITAIGSDVIDCTVEACLFSESLNVIELCRIPIDVSYHFQMCKERKSKVKSMQEQLVCISNLYTALEPAQTPVLQHQMLSNLTKDAFVRCVIQNCFHRLDLEMFSCEDKDVIEVQLAIGDGDDSRVTLEFNALTRVLKISSHVCWMVHLKKYFMRHVDAENACKNVDVLLKRNKPLDEVNLLAFYEELRKVWL